ncbi:hypothetical protein MTBLM5_450016 [Magnetospirillum sp. LM-5]|nr:hypothetical protein MTBLM5_450016 [Magnetospirillum sp. LM-5]
MGRDQSGGAAVGRYLAFEDGLATAPNVLRLGSRMLLSPVTSRAWRRELVICQRATWTASLTRPIPNQSHRFPTSTHPIPPLTRPFRVKSRPAGMDFLKSHKPLAVPAGFVRCSHPMVIQQV